MILTILLIIAIFIVLKKFYFKKQEHKCEHESNMFIGSTTNEDFLQFHSKKKLKKKKSKK